MSKPQSNSEGPDGGREHPNDPLHGVTLKAIVAALVERHDWPALAARIPIRCFWENPSLSSSLKFLRRTEWARKKVEQLYLEDLRRIERNRNRNRERAARRALGALEAGRVDSCVQSAPEPADDD